MPDKFSPINSRRQRIARGEARVSLAEVLAALSFALDLTEGQPAGHAVRSCVIGMHIASEIGLPVEAQSDLYYASLMKDAGCSTNASKMMQILGTDDIAGKRDAVAMDWTHTGWESLQFALSHVKTGAPFLERMRALFEMAVHQKENSKLLHQMRCERGASVARKIGLREGAASAIQCLNEHWNGLGQPQGLRGEHIPVLSRIMNIAQTADVFYSRHGKSDAAGAMEIVRHRAGRWFEPDLARSFCSLGAREAVWVDIANASERVIELEPSAELIDLNETTLDNICFALAEVIDAKSPFTYRHSTGVADAAVAIAGMLSLDERDVIFLRRAALLHDIGKLSVPNTILDKPGKLTEDEWSVVRKHPYYSYEILKRIPGFDDLANIAASHHEKLDGTGYFRNLSATELSLPARILVVADIYDALAAKRPYRDALPLEKVLGIISSDVPRALDPSCFEALKAAVDSASGPSASLAALSSAIKSPAIQPSVSASKENHDTVPQTNPDRTHSR